MQTSLPDTINLWHFAAEGGHAAGELPLQKMPRLSTLLSAHDGVASVALQAGIDAQGTRFITGHLEVSLEVTCQRCMKPMTAPLQLDFRLGLVMSEEQSSTLSDNYEPLVAAESETSIYDVIEDEIILGLPFAPMCDDPKQCQNYVPLASEAVVEKTNPFATLAMLLKDSKTEE